MVFVVAINDFAGPDSLMGTSLAALLLLGVSQNHIEVKIHCNVLLSLFLYSSAVVSKLFSDQ